ncbi:MAG: hypothetical protein OEY56_13455 [Cyclobacteriaceae bacterium]|nr:hypothetical protein [Cyclobacteriaceae bacterium]
MLDKRLVVQGRELHKTTSLPMDNLKVSKQVSSEMTMEQIKSCIRNLKGFKIQNKNGGMVSPYWGLFIQEANKLPAKYFDKIREVVYLKHFGNIPKQTSLIIKFDPKDYTKVNNRWVRAIKIKGISNRIKTIKKGELRHIRFLGQGNIPFLLPYTNPDGTREDIRFDVGEPYGAKRFRSVLNEVVLTQYAFSQGCAVMVPIGMGIYEDIELLYKGEPIAFSIWGIEHPDDLRSADELDARFFHMLDEIEVSSSDEKKWKAFEKALTWMRQHHAQIIAEMRKNHDTGFTHHEVHFNNTSFFRNSLTILDWEEAAHRCNLTRHQFLDSVVIDLVRLIENCCSEEMVYNQHYNRVSLLAKDSGIEIPVFQTVNYFMYYFHEDEVNQDDREKLQSLQEKLLTESQKEIDLIEKLVRRLVFTVFGKGSFGKGIDWKDVAQPFISGFSDDNPLWQPEATTTFDPKLFVQKGGWPYGKKKRHPTKAIRRAEEAIYEGRFQDAIKVYENILCYGYKRNRDFDNYIHHNLASLYLVLYQDEKAKKHFELKAFI